MKTTTPRTRVGMAVMVAALALATGEARAQSQLQGPVPSPKGDGSTMTPMRRTTQVDRMKAALRMQERLRAQEAAKKKAGPSASVQTPAGSGLGGLRGAALSAVLDLATAQLGGTPDLYAEPNYALSKLPVATCAYSLDPNTQQPVQCQKDSDCPGYLPPFLVGANTFPGGETCTGPVVANTGIQKFVDDLPGLCPAGTTGDCIPVAIPDTTTFPGEHYYEIGLADYTRVFHRDIPATKVRGYYQINTTDPGANTNHYLGPIIVGVQGIPIRVKFVNQLGTVNRQQGTGPGSDGTLFIPVDTNISGVNYGPLGPGGGFYTQNRATIHLHGGNTPWVSDGTQHQWTVPADDPTPYQRGLSARDVPDMWFDGAGNILPAICGCQGKLTCTSTDPLCAGATTNPGPGALTFYYPNQQSSRLMFYHDHAYGITRLNVYAGEAAGFVLTDAAEQDMINGTPTAPKVLPDIGIPLVLQDKTFVPPDAQLTWQDRTWDAAKWGGEGSLWYPHVYTPNQWPGNPDLSNTNPFGRWDYGPFFHPVQTQLIGVDWQGNATQRPLLQACQTAALATATSSTGTTDCPTTPLPSLVPESFFDTPLVNGTAYPKVSVPAGPVRFRMLNAAQERNFNLSWFVADSTGTEVTMVEAVPHSASTVPALCTPSATRDPVTGLPAGCWPAEWPADARQGGVPDPTTAGPQWIQIGSESGFLPAPALIPAMPVGYETNKRNVVVLNVANKGLFMGPAERADVIVDFTTYSGMTLILYNDAPAPVPAGDPRQDYFTGAPDLTTTGGAPTTLPGYGPNIRTVMQVYVDPGLPPPPALDLAALGSALRSAFVATQLVPIVPEKAYDKMYPTVNNPTGAIATNTYFGIGTLTASFAPVGSDVAMPFTFANKALHELFTTDFGRMNSLLGVEIPNTNWLNQTTIPFANYDPTTEFILDGQPQVWKITHNGVDTHTIHFHLLNAQIVNRVGWDGQVRPPDANELGWKESIRMNPLEDIFIALQPYRQTLPWPMPDMVRPIDVDRCVDGTALPGGGTCAGNSQFTGVDIYNNPIIVKNQPTNLGWEYVWHCHLLGHEEEDMLRAEVFVTAPETPAGLAVVGSPPALGAPRFTLSWSDMSMSAQYFNIQRSTDSTFPAAGTTSLQTPVPFCQAPPCSLQYVDTTASVDTTYFYRAQAGKTLVSQAVTTGAAAGSPMQTFTATSGYVQAGNSVGVRAILQLDRSALTFGPTVWNVQTAAQTVTVSNVGTVGVPITGITITGSYASQFTQTNKCPKTLAAGATCTISVTFRPTLLPPALVPTMNSTNLTVAFSAAGSPKSVSLTGQVLYPVDAVSPASWSFGPGLAVGSTTSKVFTVTNTGTAPMTISSITLSGSNKNQFSLVNGCGPSLAAGAACSVTVSFKPTSTGTKNATLNVNVANPATSAVVPLKGN